MPLLTSTGMSKLSFKSDVGACPMHFSYHLCCVVSSLNRISNVARGTCQFRPWPIRLTLKAEETFQKCGKFFVFCVSLDSDTYAISSAGVYAYV